MSEREHERGNPELMHNINALRDLVGRVENNPSEFEDNSTELIGKLEGMSGRKFRLLLSEFASCMPEGLAYLELGIYQGLTPLTVARRNPLMRVIGVDDFSQFDVGGENRLRIDTAVEALDIDNFEFFDEDFERFLISDPAGIKGKVGIYFFDASHDYRSQILALMHAPSWLAEGGIIVVDDCNYPHVRQATVDFLHTNPEYKLLCEFYTGEHPYYRSSSPRKQKKAGRLRQLSSTIRRFAKPDQKHEQEQDHEHTRFCQETWWNGVNIIVHDPLDTLVPIFPNLPETLRSKFLKQHGFAGRSAKETVNHIAEVRRVQ